VVVLDIMLPDGDGVEFLPEIRERSDAAVLFLTAKTERADKLAGLRAGGNDYLTKPYDIDELRAKVANFMALVAEGRSRAATVKVGPLTLDARSGRASLDGVDLMLKPKEFGLLMVLAENEGRVVAAEDLYEKVWNLPPNGDTRALWPHLSKLRTKLQRHRPGVFSVDAVYGQGYRLRWNRTPNS
jgi:DNA-binding response OmpR family regulator